MAADDPWVARRTRMPVSQSAVAAGDRDQRYAVVHGQRAGGNGNRPTRGHGGVARERVTAEGHAVAGLDGPAVAAVVGAEGAAGHDHATAQDEDGTGAVR